MWITGLLSKVPILLFTIVPSVSLPVWIAASFGHLNMMIPRRVPITTILHPMLLVSPLAILSVMMTVALFPLSLRRRNTSSLWLWWFYVQTVTRVHGLAFLVGAGSKGRLLLSAGTEQEEERKH